MGFFLAHTLLLTIHCISNAILARNRQIGRQKSWPQPITSTCLQAPPIPSVFTPDESCSASGIAPVTLGIPSAVDRFALGIFRVYPKCIFYLRSYHAESTGSRPITAVKQRRAWTVLRWVTASEHQVL